MSEKMWHIVVTSIRHACDVTLYCLRQLMTPFQRDSDSFYGDMGQVKVAVRRDCSGIECERLRQLAQQVRDSGQSCAVRNDVIEAIEAR